MEVVSLMGVHFRSKNDIIHWLEKHCPRKAIVRSLNGAELLGGFDPIPPTTRAGWIVRVTSGSILRPLSLRRKKWIVTIIPYVGKPDCEIRILKEVPWGNWSGRSVNLINSVYSGDRPWLYAAMQERANENT